MNCCHDVARIGKRVTGDREHLAERSTQAMHHHILGLSCRKPSCGCSARTEERLTLGGSLAQPECREEATFPQPSRERSRESRLTGSWRTEQLDNHACPCSPAKASARFRA